MRDLALVRRRGRLLYALDENGRMVGRARRGYPAGPRLAMTRSPVGNTWYFRSDLPSDLVAELTEYCHAEPIPFALDRPPLYASAIRALLADYAPGQREYRGPAFALQPPNHLPRGPVLVRAEDPNVFTGPLAFVRAELTDVQPCFAMVEGGQAVSVCYCARNGRWAAEAGLDTIEAFRRRGYGTAVAMAWAVAVAEQGRLPLYSTTWDNIASRTVARRLGGHLYAEDWYVT